MYTEKIGCASLFSIYILPYVARCVKSFRWPTAYFSPAIRLSSAFTLRAVSPRQVLALDKK